jgi:hypothetical protein
MIRIKPSSARDRKALSDFVDQLRESPKLLEQCGHDMADETVGLVMDGFRAEADPYGTKWRRKQAQDGRKVLSGKTSRLKGGWHVSRANRRGFIVSPAVDYAKWHQGGTRRLVRRAMIPFDGRIPAKWLGIYRDVFVDRMTLHFARNSSKAARARIRRFARKVF